MEFIENANGRHCAVERADSAVTEHSGLKLLLSASQAVVQNHHVAISGSIQPISYLPYINGALHEIGDSQILERTLECEVARGQELIPAYTLGDSMPGIIDHDKGALLRCRCLGNQRIYSAQYVIACNDRLRTRDECNAENASRPLKMLRNDRGTLDRACESGERSIALGEQPR